MYFQHNNLQCWNTLVLTMFYMDGSKSQDNHIYRLARGHFGDQIKLRTTYFCHDSSTIATFLKHLIF